MKLLDLFCGAGGAAMGYSRAGFQVVGVDIKPQPRFPFQFVQADALHLLRHTPRAWLAQFDAIHASPPCQRYSSLTKAERRDNHPDLLIPIQQELQKLRVPYVIENVFGSPLRRGAFMLCGASFGLLVRRHRYFSAPWIGLANTPMCICKLMPKQFRPSTSIARRHYTSRFVAVYGSCHKKGDLELRRKAMGIEWMTNREIIEAIPPAYTKWIGTKLMLHLADPNRIVPAVQEESIK